MGLWRANWGTDDFHGVRFSTPLPPPFDHWTVRPTFVFTDGRPTLVDLRLRPTLPEDYDEGSDGAGEDYEPWYNEEDFRALAVADNPEGVTSRLLRAVSVFDLERQAQDLAKTLLDSGDLGVFDAATEEAAESFERPGRWGRPDSVYAVWAVRYVERLEAGSRSPVSDLAEQYDLQQRQVRDRLREARQRGLMTSTGRGRAGGELTDKGRAALAEAQDDDPDELMTEVS